MFTKSFQFSVRSAVGLAALALAVQGAQAALVSNNLSGNIEYNGWDSLTSTTTGLSTATLSTAPGFGSNEAGSGDANLLRTSGFHYPASASLYSFAGNSTLEISDTTPVSGVETVVFSILTWPNPSYGAGNLPASSIATAPVLNLNGGSSALPADYSGSQYNGPFSGGGFNVESYIHTWQWDLSDDGAVSSFDIDWEQIVHAGVLAMQLEQSDAFSVSPAAVPEPGAIAIASLLGLGVVFRRQRRA